MKASQPSAEVRLEGWFGPAEAAPTLDEGQPVGRGGDRTHSIAKAMLAQLGQLDRRDDREPAWTGREGFPRFDSRRVSSESPQEVRPLGNDPFSGPRRVERRRPRRCKRGSLRRATRPAPKIRSTAGGPPRVV